jgi:hypothetical protein
MRKINKKILVAALSLLLVACAFVTILSFTMAADGDPDEGKTVEASPSFEVVTIYNIDRIIQNSINGSDPLFHIVEISSSDSDSAMGKEDTLVARTSNVFTEYVFNGHATIEERMAEGNIHYEKFSTASMTSDSAIQECVDALVKADLIYVHNDSSNYFGKNGNDIPELVKLQLCSAAVGDFVPFIIDGPIATQEIIGSNTNKYQNLVTNVFKKYGGKKYTYQWEPSAQGTALEYFTHQTSLYVQIDGKTQKNKWTKVYGFEDYDLANLPADDPAASPTDAEKIDRTKNYVKIADNSATIGRILVINNTATDGAISTLVKNSVTEFTGNVVLEEDVAGAKEVNDKDGNKVKLIEKVVDGSGKQTAPPIYNSDNVKLYSVPETSGLYSAYIVRNAHPNYMSFEYYASDDVALDTIDYSLYDIVIIESGAGLKDISATNYDHLVAAMNASQHILYDKALVGTVDNTITVVDYGDNYDYVCGKVMTSTESGKYDNILVTNNVRMNAYMSANNSAAVKDIADIINYASYRGIGKGEGDSSNTYTVLEIEPAYPIDTRLATLFANINGGGSHIKGFVDPLEKNGYKTDMTFAQITGRSKPFDRSTGAKAANSWYYIRNQGVIDNSSSDEISFDGTTSLTTFLESSSSVITEEMLGSVTDYYAWKVSKAKVCKLTGLEYNQVNVIHMSSYEFNCSKRTCIDNYDMIYIGGDNSAIKDASAFDSSKLSSIGHNVYNMYFCDGDAYPYNENYGSSQGATGTFIGNDLTDNKLDELNEYRGKGMPIVIDKSVVSGMSTSIDPNSNMKKFIDACSADVTNGKKNICWNFDFDDTVKVANGGEYGDTYEGYVTVFRSDETEDYAGRTVTAPTNSTGVNGENIKQMLKNSSARPKLVITSSPIQYKEGDRSTWITDRNLVWKYEAAGGDGFTAKLIFDDNSNSRFDDDPVVSSDSGKSGMLSKKMGTDFFGVIYWKLEVENSAGLKASTTGCIKIARTNQEKIQINLLQIMPDAAIGDGDNADVSLFLCTECQQARHVLYGTRHAEVGKYAEKSEIGLANSFVDTHNYTTSYLSKPTDVTGKVENYLTNAQTEASPAYLGMAWPGKEASGGADTTEYRGTINIDVYANWDYRVYSYSIDASAMSARLNVYYDGQVQGGTTVTGSNDSDSNPGNYSKHDIKVTIAGYNSNTGYDGGGRILINGEEKVKFTNGETSFTVNTRILASDEGSSEDSSYSEFEFNAINNLGIHEHKFGIVKYDSQRVVGKYTGLDDWTTNWFDEVTEDYNVDMNILYLSEYEKLVEDIEKAYESCANEDEVNTLKSKYHQASAEFRNAYNGMVKVINNTYKNDVAHGGLTVAERDALQKFFLREETFNYGYIPTAEEIANAETEANKEADKKTADFAKETDPVQARASFVAAYKEALLNELRYANFESIFDPFAASGSKIETFLRDAAAAGSTLDGKVNAAEFQKEVAYELSYENYDDRPYYDLFSLTNDLNGNSANGSYNYKKYCELYATWRDAKMYEQFFRKMYQLFAIFSGVNESGKADLAQYYDCIIFGAAQNFAGADMSSDAAIDAIIRYVDNGGQAMLFYDTLTSTSQTGKMVNRLGGYFGINTNATDKSKGSQNPVKLTYRDATGDRTFNDSNFPSPMFNYTIYVGSANATDEGHTHPDKNLFEMALDEKVETNAAEQNNEGIVTMYPFSIGSNLRLSPTEESDFTINIEDEDLIVYYSLSGGTSGTISSAYAADPKDGANNYFVYQYQPGGEGSGMVTYLGAGRTQITGTTRENNDERRFFINLILNTGRKSTKTTELSIFDHSSTQVVDTSNGKIGATNTTNGVVEEDGDIYKMTVAADSIPEFSYRVTSDSSVEISEVFIYYDLDYDVNPGNDEYTNDANHILVYDKKYNKSGTYNKDTNPWIASGYLAWVDTNTAIKSSTATVTDVNGNIVPQSMLTLKDSYLYNNEYTYLVVKVVTTKGDPIYKRIKIIIKPELFDLS